VSNGLTIGQEPIFSDSISQSMHRRSSTTENRML